MKFNVVFNRMHHLASCVLTMYPRPTISGLLGVEWQSTISLFAWKTLNLTSHPLKPFILTRIPTMVRPTARLDEERDLVILREPVSPAHCGEPILGGPRGAAGVRLRDARIPRSLLAGFILGQEVRARFRRRGPVGFQPTASTKPSMYEGLRTGQ